MNGGPAPAAGRLGPPYLCSGPDTLRIDHRPSDSGHFRRRRDAATRCPDVNGGRVRTRTPVRTRLVEMHKEVEQEVTEATESVELAHLLVRTRTQVRDGTFGTRTASTLPPVRTHLTTCGGGAPLLRKPPVLVAITSRAPAAKSCACAPEIPGLPLRGAPRPRRRRLRSGHFWRVTNSREKISPDSGPDAFVMESGLDLSQDGRVG
jgi:hypothetical protein